MLILITAMEVFDINVRQFNKKLPTFLSVATPNEFSVNPKLNLLSPHLNLELKLNFSQ